MDLSEVLYNSEFCHDFQILRSTSGQFVSGGFQDAKSEISVCGIVTAASDKEINMQPEGDRVTGAMVFHCEQELFITHSGPMQGTSDIILWEGQQWRIVKILPYGKIAGFHRGLGVRMSAPAVTT